MRKPRFTEEQIAFALRQSETGTPVAEIARKLGGSQRTFYRWKKKCAGLGVPELRRLRLREGHRRVGSSTHRCGPGASAGGNVP